MMNDIEILTNENEIEVKGEKIVVTPYSWKNTSFNTVNGIRVHAIVHTGNPCQ